MLVTSIIKQNKKKSLIIFDEEIKVCLYNSELYKYGIQEGIEISDDVYREIFTELLPKRVKERTFYMLKDSDKSEFDVRTKLLTAYYPKDIVEDVISYMKNMKYIDDSRFADNYIRNNFRRKSINRIKSELMLHRIDKSIISELISLLEKEEFVLDEQLEIIRKEFVRRKYDFQIDDSKLKNKIIMSLIRKGFDFDSIDSVYRSMKEEAL